MPASQTFDEFIANFPKLKKPIFGRDRARQHFEAQVREHLVHNLHLIDDENKENTALLHIAQKKHGLSLQDYADIPNQTLQALLLTYAMSDLKFLPFLSRLLPDKQLQLLQALNDQNSLAPLSVEQFVRVQKGFWESSQLALAESYLESRPQASNLRDLLEISKNFGEERLNFLNNFLSKKQADGKSMFETISPTEFAESVANQSELQALTLTYLNFDLGTQKRFQTLSLQDFVRLNMAAGYNADLIEAYGHGRDFSQEQQIQLHSPRQMLELHTHNDWKLGDYLNFDLGDGIKRLQAFDLEQLQNFLAAINFRAEDVAISYLEKHGKNLTVADLVGLVSKLYEDRYDVAKYFLNIKKDDGRSHMQSLSLREFLDLKSNISDHADHMRAFTNTAQYRLTESYLSRVDENGKSNYQTLSPEEFIKAVNFLTPLSRHATEEASIYDDKYFKYLTANLEDDKPRFQSIDLAQLAPFLLHLSYRNVNEVIIPYIENHALSAENLLEILKNPQYSRNYNFKLLCDTYLDSNLNNTPRFQTLPFEQFLALLHYSLNTAPYFLPYVETHLASLDFNLFLQLCSVVKNSPEKEEVLNSFINYTKENGHTRLQDLSPEQFALLVRNGGEAFIDPYLRATNAQGQERYQTFSLEDFLKSISTFADTTESNASKDNFVASYLNYDSRLQNLTIPQLGQLMGVFADKKPAIEAAISYFGKHQALSFDDYKALKTSLDRASFEDKQKFVQAYLSSLNEEGQRHYQTMTFEQMLAASHNFEGLDYLLFEIYLSAKNAEGQSRWQTISDLEICQILNCLVEDEIKLFLPKLLTNQPDRSAEQILATYISDKHNATVFASQNKIAHFIASGFVDKTALPQVFRAAHPSDLQLVEFYNALNLYCISDEENKTFGKNLLELLTDKEAIVLLIQGLSEKRLIDSELEKLELLKGICKKRYAQMHKALTTISVERLPAESLQTLGGIFGAQFKPAEYSLAEVLSYYDILGNIGGFSSLLTPDLKIEITKNYKLPKDSVYFTSADYALLTSIVDLRLPNLTLFSSFLAARKKPVPADILQNPQLNFADVFYIRGEGSMEEKQARVSAQYGEIIKNIPTSDEALTFLQNFFDEEDWKKISDANKTKVAESFLRNPRDTAFLFSQDGALAEFVAETTTGDDGCVKNFAAKFDAMLGRHLMPDQNCVKLYKFYLDKIFTPIGQNNAIVGDVMHGGDGSGDVVLRNEVINAQFLNPHAFIEQFVEFMQKDLKEYGRLRKDFEKTHLQIEDELQEFFETLSPQDLEVGISTMFSVALEDDAMEDFIGRYDMLDRAIAGDVLQEFLQQSEVQNYQHFQEFGPQVEKFVACLNNAIKEVSVADVQVVIEAKKLEEKANQTTQVVTVSKFTEGASAGFNSIR